MTVVLARCSFVTLVLSFVADCKKIGPHICYHYYQSCYLGSKKMYKCLFSSPKTISKNHAKNPKLYLQLIFFPELHVYLHCIAQISNKFLSYFFKCSFYKTQKNFRKKSYIVRGHPKTMLTIFPPIFTTYLPPVDIFTK